MYNEYYGITASTCAGFSLQDWGVSGWVGGCEAPDFVSSICGGATQFCDLQMREGIIVKHKIHCCSKVGGHVSWSLVNNPSDITVITSIHTIAGSLAAYCLYIAQLHEQTNSDKAHSKHASFPQPGNGPQLHSHSLETSTSSFTQPGNEAITLLAHKWFRVWAGPSKAECDISLLSMALPNTEKWHQLMLSLDTEENH